MLKPIVFFWLLLPAWPLLSQPLATLEIKYVWARSGLNLRKTPDFKGEKITTLPYGTKVLLKEYPDAVRGENDFGDYELPVEIWVDAIKWPGQNDPEMTHKVAGSWAKANANGLEGYLFTGYLSEMEPFSGFNAADMNKIPSVEEGFAMLKAGMFLKHGALKNSKDYIIYANGAFEHYGRFRWVFPNMTPEDGYLLANFFFALEKKCLAPKDQEQFTFAGATTEGMEFDYNYEGANFILRLTFSDGVVVLTSEWGGD